jgi:hypothetical protein
MAEEWRMRHKVCGYLAISLVLSLIALSVPMSVWPFKRHVFPILSSGLKAIPFVGSMAIVLLVVDQFCLRKRPALALVAAVLFSVGGIVLYPRFTFGLIGGTEFAVLLSSMFLVEIIFTHRGLRWVLCGGDKLVLRSVTGFCCVLTAAVWTAGSLNYGEHVESGWYFFARRQAHKISLRLNWYYEEVGSYPESLALTPPSDATPFSKSIIEQAREGIHEVRENYNHPPYGIAVKYAGPKLSVGPRLMVECAHRRVYVQKTGQELREESPKTEPQVP